jgi:hypothetical protein
MVGVRKLCTSTVVKTPKHIHIFCGVNASSMKEIDLSIPTVLISIIVSQNGAISGIIFTRNRRKEQVRVYPDGNDYIEDNNIPKRIVLAGQVFKEEPIVSVEKVQSCFVRPDYFRI